MSKKRKPKKKFSTSPRANPQKAANLANEAIEFCRCGDYKHGIRLFRKAEERDGRNNQILLNLGIAYHATGDFSAARKYYVKAMKLKPEYVVKILQNGINDLAMNKLESAECSIGAVRDIDPANITVQLATGSLMLRQGDTENGARILRECYAEDPKMTSAVVELAESSLLTAEDIKSIQDNITLGAVDRKNQKFLQLALGKGYQLQGEYQKAFECFVQANEEFARESKLTCLQAAKDLEAHVAIVKEVVTPDFMSKFGEHGQEDTNLIFVVGLPRSGLHDVAYILQDSGAAVLAGEMNWCNQKVFQMLQANEDNFARAVNSLSDETVSSLYNDYLNILAGLRRSGKYVVNCKAVNLINVWFIKLIFPNAKIVYTRRDFADQVMEIYCNNIPGMEYLNDLDAITQYCKSAVDLMDYWNKLFGGDLICFDYADFSADPEVEYKRLLSALDITEYSDIAFTRVSSPSLVVSEICAPEIPLHEMYSEFCGVLTAQKSPEKDEFKLDFSNFDAVGVDQDSGLKLDIKNKSDTSDKGDDTEGFKLNF